MTSSIFWLRTELGAWAPSTQAMASTTLDLPEPLGPTTTVTPGSRSSVVASANDLKPLRVRLFRNTAPAKLPAPTAAVQGCTASIRVFEGVRVLDVGKSHRWHSDARQHSDHKRWHHGQKWVLRPPLTVRRMIAPPARSAALAGPPVHDVIVLVRALGTHQVDVLVVAQRRASGADRGEQDAVHGVVQPADLVPSQRAGGPERVDAWRRGGSRRRRCCRRRR